MQKSTDGVPRQAETGRTARTRSSRSSHPARLNRRSIATARAVQAWIGGHASAPAGNLRAALAAALRPFSTAERALPVAVAAIVAVASLLALLPNTSAGAVGGVQGRGQDVRIAVSGGLGRGSGYDATAPGDGTTAPGDGTTAPRDGTTAPRDGTTAPRDGTTAPRDGTTGSGSIDGGLSMGESFLPIVLPDDAATAVGDAAAPQAGSLLEDGTLVTGYAPDTTVEDGSDLIVRYKVKSGDTLVTIAHKFDVSMMTLWWANKLKAKDDLHIGQVLRIPPVSGLVVTVAETDTIDSLAATYKSKASRILAVNGLGDSTLVAGQVLVIPGAKGAPIPTPKPTPKPKPRTSSGSSSHATSNSRSGGGGTPTHYSGGSFHWPVVGGGNYVSQYFHDGHGAIDIAADYGSPVVAAGGGRVAFAGWKSNGGGWQVWINHGSGLWTTYNHMSALSVGSGQWVGKGQRVGRIGASGWATGPHLHFEVWAGGEPWSGGTQTNPMRYF